MLEEEERQSSSDCGQVVMEDEAAMPVPVTVVTPELIRCTCT